jgi:hypothetical protein
MGVTAYYGFDENRIQFSTNLQRMVRLIEQFCIGLNGKGKHCLQKTGTNAATFRIQFSIFYY